MPTSQPRTPRRWLAFAMRSTLDIRVTLQFLVVVLAFIHILYFGILIGGLLESSDTRGRGIGLVSFMLVINAFLVACRMLCDMPRYDSAIRHSSTPEVDFNTSRTSLLLETFSGVALILSGVLLMETSASKHCRIHLGYAEYSENAQPPFCGSTVGAKITMAYGALFSLAAVFLGLIPILKAIRDRASPASNRSNGDV